MKKGEKILFGFIAFLVVVTVINFTVLESIRHKSNKQFYPILTHFVFTEEGKRGYLKYQDNECDTCHRAVGSGTNMGVSLDGLGSKHDLNYFINFLKDPEKTMGHKTLDHGNPPKEAAFVSQLPETDRHEIAVFLSELKSDQGSSSSFEPPPGESSFIDAMVDMWTPGGWRTQYVDIRDWMKNKTKEDPHDAKH